MTKEQVLEFVQNKFDIQGSSDRVFEISASRAAYASNFRSEYRMNPDIDEPQSMETAEMLARQAFGDMWEDEFPEASMGRMLKAADRIWSKSGFADFLERAIAVLIAQAAPRTLSSALNDASGRLTELQNYTNLQKGSFGQDVAKLKAAIDALENDLRKLNDCRDNLKVEVVDLRRSLEQKLSSNLVDMQAQSREQLKRIFGRKEYSEAGLVKKAGLGLTKLVGLLVGQDYQGTGEIKFRSANEANKFVETATASVKMIVNDLMSDAREDAWREVKSLRNRIEKLLRTKTKPIIEQAQRRLSKQFNVTLELHEMFDELYLEDIGLDIQAKSRSREYTEYKTVKERRWYSLWLYEHKKKAALDKISNDSAKLKEAVEKQKKHVGEILKSKQ